MFRSLTLLLLLWMCFAEKGFSAESIDIAAEDDAGLWSQKDGTGLANDIVLAAYKAEGIEARLTVMPYARCKNMVVSAEIVACFSMSKYPALAETIVFADRPLFVCHADLFHSLSHPLTIKSEKDIPKGTVVGTVRGYEYPDLLNRLKENGTVVFEEVDAEELNLKKLVDGRIQLAVINQDNTKPAMALMLATGTVGKVESVFRCGDLESFLAFSKKHPKSEWAREKFNSGMKKIEADGTLAQIQKKWEDIANAALKKQAGAREPAPTVPVPNGK